MVELSKSDSRIFFISLLTSLLVNLIILFYLLYIRVEMGSQFDDYRMQDDYVFIAPKEQSYEDTAPIEWAATQEKQSPIETPGEESVDNELPFIMHDEKEESDSMPIEKAQSNILQQLPENVIGDTAVLQEIKDTALVPDKQIRHSQLQPQLQPEKILQKSQKKNVKLPLTLAQLARGFVDYQQNGGSHAVTMLGKEGATPSDEQLKHERYLHKINTCLYNSLRIHNKKIPMIEKKYCSLRIRVELNADATIRTLQVVESSGYKQIDNFVLFIFHDASSAFPPIPTYLFHDSYQVIYKVELNMRSNRPIRASR